MKIVFFKNIQAKKIMQKKNVAYAEKEHKVTCHSIWPRIIFIIFASTFKRQKNKTKTLN